MNAVEPSDMFEYISRHFKAYNFNDMHRIQAKSLYIIGWGSGSRNTKYMYRKILKLKIIEYGK